MSIYYDKLYFLFISGASSRPMHKVAFFAGLADNMGPVTEHTDIKFDRVVTNIGNG